jgi:HEAT repeat protein
VAESTVILKKCPQCSKDIPASIRVCPYCQRDEKGQMPDATPEMLAVDGQLRQDLKQLESEDPFARKAAADRIHQKGLAAIPLLVSFINEHTRKGVPEVAKLLGRLRDPRATSALLQAMKVGDEEVRTAALWALSQMNDSQALAALINEADRTHPLMQAYLAHALMGHQDPRISPALARLAQNSSREVAFQAIWSLGENGDAGAIPLLRRLLTRTDPVLKTAAQVALRRLGGPVRRLYPWWIWVCGASVLGVVGYVVWHFYK